DVEPVVSGIAWGANESERRGRPMRIRSFAKGHEPKNEGTLPLYDPDEATILTTRAFAASIGLDVGGMVTVVAPRTRLTPFGPVPVWKKFRIARLATEANDERAADAYLETSDAEALFATNGKPTSIEMY